ncbi:transient receptor potential cation channel subfamily a member [Anaeramoeba flamelloides]|uniref:Transient receptor potential cation channel subfamily a member n=1 Tax=Anaeramoeba flamelloides TaxID=1746091 RepID=A0AAV8A826_9EUKA|nr:transient receptor potential cation channel subfamily a member [Anaeramoeba flamelloides]
MFEFVNLVPESDSEWEYSSDEEDEYPIISNYEKKKYLKSSLSEYSYKKITLSELKRKTVDGLTILHLLCQRSEKPTELIEDLITQCLDLCTEELVQTRFKGAFHFYCSNCEMNNKKLFQKFLDAGFGVNQKNYERETPFEQFLNRFHLDCEILKVFLQNGADVNGKFSDGSYPIQILANQVEPDFYLLKEFHSKGSSLKCIDSEGWCLLHYICSMKAPNYEIVEWLASKGSQLGVQEQNDLRTPLHFLFERFWEAPELRIKILQLFNRYGADLNLIDQFGNNVFLMVVKSKPKHYSSLDYLQLFEKFNINFSQQDRHGDNCLHVLCKNNQEIDLGWVKFLIKRRVSVNHFNISGESPLVLICKGVSINWELIAFIDQLQISFLKHLEEDDPPLILLISRLNNKICPNREMVLKFLKNWIKQTKDFNQEFSSFGNIFNYLCSYYPNYELLALLVQRGIRLDSLDNNKSTCLHLLCDQTKKDIEVKHIKLIIENNKELINKIDQDGMSALMYSCCSDKDLKIIHYLLINGANPNTALPKGKNSLYFAHRDFEKIKLLIEFGAIIDKENYSFLQVVCTNFNTRLEIVQYLIKKGANAKYIGSGYTIPQRICQSYTPDTEILKELLQAGADVNHLSRDKNNCLHEICKNPNTKKPTVKLLIEYGINVNAINSNSATPLSLAIHCSAKNDHIIRYLIRNGADVNHLLGDKPVMYEYFTRTHLSLKTIGLFLKKGAALNKNDEYVASPIWSLIDNHYNHKSIVQIFELCSKYFKVININDDRNATILHKLLQKGEICFEFVEYLLKKGINPNSYDLENEAAFHSLVGFQNDRFDLIKLLYKYETKLTLKNRNGQNLLHLFCIERIKNLDHYQFLLDIGLDINCQDNRGNIPLIYILDYEDLEISFVNFFIQNSCDLSLTDNHKRSALHYLVKNRSVSLELIQLFHSNGVDPLKEDSDGCSALVEYFDSHKKYDTGIVKYFLEQGIDVNTNITGHGLLHYVCDNDSENFELMKLLINKGININMCWENSSKTPLYFLCENITRLDILKYFFENGAKIQDDNCLLSQVLYSYKFSEDCLIYLIERGCNIIKPRFWGESLLVKLSKYFDTKEKALMYVISKYKHRPRDNCFVKSCMNICQIHPLQFKKYLDAYLENGLNINQIEKTSRKSILYVLSRLIVKRITSSKPNSRSFF